MKTFSERVLAAALAIPRGRVATYGDIVRAAGGGAMAAQSVTTILGKAYARGEKGIPWHRIVYANGRVWLDPEHKHERLKLYQEEGIVVDQKERIRDFAEIRFDFKKTKQKTQ